jgi:hypothetical protein
MRQKSRECVFNITYHLLLLGTTIRLSDGALETIETTTDENPAKARHHDRQMVHLLGVGARPGDIVAL